MISLSVYLWHLPGAFAAGPLRPGRRRLLGGMFRNVAVVAVVTILLSTITYYAVWNVRASAWSSGSGRIDASIPAAGRHCAVRPDPGCRRSVFAVFPAARQTVGLSDKATRPPGCPSPSMAPTWRAAAPARW